MRDVLLAQDYQPRSELIVPEHLVPHSRFRAIDAHNHLTHAGFDVPELGELLRMMDYLNLQMIVNLSGGTGDQLKERLATFDLAHPGRFATFCNVDWSGVGTPGWAETRTAQLEADVRAGARGLKVFKSLGLEFRDVTNELVMPDDPRLFDVWEQAAELGIPVLIHAADPRAFFRPLDRANERWDELHRRPNWHFYGPEFPAFEELIESLYRLIEAHPRTTFITAHVGCYPENIGFVSQMMDRYPNLYTDFSARIAELGRAPYSARAFFCKYADRIVFGTDHTPNVTWYQTYFRFLETADEYFTYSPGSPFPRNGRWHIYGVYLPDDVLQKVYYDNAARLLGLSRGAQSGK